MLTLRFLPRQEMHQLPPLKIIRYSYLKHNVHDQVNICSNHTQFELDWIRTRQQNTTFRVKFPILLWLHWHLIEVNQSHRNWYESVKLHDHHEQLYRFHSDIKQTWQCLPSLKTHQVWGYLTLGWPLPDTGDTWHWGDLYLTLGWLLPDTGVTSTWHWGDPSLPDTGVTSLPDTGVTSTWHCGSPVYTQCVTFNVTCKHSQGENICTHTVTRQISNKETLWPECFG